ncbi:DUF262 domain-containing protein [Nonomuraea sp. SBT364]|uniref:DUF262 domain-containing protein n=1 Tax=Nonomuraea sp. SBT364 TaxID=1580530 RepID=UPI00066BAD97|nr:DUF262 domain-containing protein [Nonomuraea sp. SBT364]
MALEAEIEQNRKNIRSDSLTMSVGEVVNMYRDREIIIQPEYQRLFRWDIEKQSRLIESLLLGIPLPPIFVSANEDGVWEVIDGLQRISTILKFMGELREEPTEQLMDPEPLVGTRYLPSLDRITWAESSRAFSGSQKIEFKRARLDFRILLKESDKKVRYDLFDRLNSGGAITSAQEVRTAILLMEHPEFYRWLDSLRNLDDFSSCVPLTTRQKEEQYDIELVLRFVALYFSESTKLRALSDMDAILTERALELAGDSDFERAAIGQNFSAVFRILSSLGPDAFRKFDNAKKKPVGAFSVSAYEAVTQGIYEHLESWLVVPEQDRDLKLLACVSELWVDDVFKKNSGAGVRPTQRIPHMRLVGSRIFAP